MADIVIKKSKISGKGVFASRNFLKGEIVLKWNPKLLDDDNFNKLPKRERIYVSYINGQHYLMQPPERYVNHSCEANTFSKDGCDITARDITRGEEITSNYGKDDVLDEFKCNCGSKKCKKII